MNIEEAKIILFHLQHINTYLDLSKDKLLIPKENIKNWKEATNTVLNELEKQQAELEKKDKVIDLMLNELAQGCNNDEIQYQKEKIKQYFSEKVSDK